MLRSIKYGLSGAVVAGVIGGTVAWTGGDGIAVRLVVDGKTSAIVTKSATVAELLNASGYTVGRHDLIAPAASATLHPGDTVVLKRGRLLHLEVDGRRRDVWTTAQTVSVALADLGFGSQDVTSVSRSRRLPLSPTDISVRTPKPVTVTADGTTEHVSTTALTARALLAELDISLGRDDRLSVPVDSPVRAGERIRVTRVLHKTTTTTRRIPFSTSSEPDSSLPLGQTTVVRAGRPGLSRTTWAVVYVNGTLVRRVRVRTTTARQPVDRLVHRGTALGPDATPAQAQQLAQSLLGEYGFGDDQMGCLIEIWDHESSWRVTAQNPGSGAYGIPQALPGSKMSSAGPDWQTNAETQVRWGLAYIRSRYGTPCNAWATWQAQGGWY